MKAMMIGLGPEYNYPGTFSKWGGKYNTRYASNFGASLIARSLMKQFGAVYVDDFSDIAFLKNNYDTCILAFANHITNWRDVSIYAAVVKQLDMKTVALSLGVQDYVDDTNITIHPSMLSLLKLVSERSDVIGVRGHYSASILYKAGIKNVAPIGCPTLFWGLKGCLNIDKKESCRRAVLVYQRTISAVRPDLFNDSVLLGQDFLDEVIMSNDPNNDPALLNYELGEYARLGVGLNVIERVRKNGIFPVNFSSWFKYISDSDFVFGPRLHGCIAGLIQGVPSVLLARDLRTSEIAEMFNIPCFTYSQLSDISVEQLYAQADYSKLIETYKRRFDNYRAVIEQNGLRSNLAGGDIASYTYDAYDIRSAVFSASNMVKDSGRRRMENGAVRAMLGRLKKKMRGL